MRSCKDRTFQKHISRDLQDQTPLLSDMAGHMLHTASSRMLITLSQFHQSWIHDLPSKNLGAPGGACKPSPPLVPVATCRYTQIGVPSPTRQGRRRSGAATTDHGPGPPRTGPEPPRARPGPLQVEAGPPGGLSHQASQAQASGPPLPARAGVRSRHVPLWARPPTPGPGAATCPTGASLPPEASPPAALNDGG